MIYFLLIYLTVLAMVLIYKNIGPSRKLESIRHSIKRRFSDIHYQDLVPLPSNLDDTLSVCWNEEEQDLECFYPAGVQTKCDANYLLNNILDTAKCKELENRGYDLSTLKFEITQKKGDKRFQSERK